MNLSTFMLCLLSFAFDLAELRNSVSRTFERRETPIPEDVPTGLSRLYGEEWGARWKAFLKREQMNAAPEDLHVMLEDLRRFLIPLTAKSSEDSQRQPGGSWGAKQHCRCAEKDIAPTSKNAIKVGTTTQCVKVRIKNDFAESET